MGVFDVWVGAASLACYSFYLVTSLSVAKAGACRASSLPPRSGVHAVEALLLGEARRKWATLISQL